MSQSELLKKVVAVLESAGTPYMLTGSYASSLQGEPRLTHDIDIVVAITAESASSLLKEFRPPDYHLDEQAISVAIRRKSQFNLLDIRNGDKVDFWLLTDDPFDQSRFARRYSQEFEGIHLKLSRPEDTILMKLRWAQMLNGSEKQIGDARSVFELNRGKLDVQYIGRWAAILGVTDLWQRLQREAESS